MLTLSSRPTLRRLFFVLSPLAALVGALLIVRFDVHSSLGISIDRETAIALARRAAAEEGMRTETWKSFVGVAPANDWRHFLSSRKDTAALADEQKLAPAVGIRVFLSHGAEWAVIRLSPDGRLLGFRRSPLEFPDAGEEVSREAARLALERRLGRDVSNRFVPAGSSRREEKKGSTRTFVWERPVAGSSEATIVAETVVAGDRILAFDVSAKVADAYKRRYAILGKTSPIVSGLTIGLVVLVLIVVAVSRLIVRAREKEVPWKRVLLLVALVILGASGGAILSDTAVFNVVDAGGDNIDSAATAAWLNGVLGAVFIGVFVGAAWGGTEGDLREKMPEKLSTFDALLGGAFLARSAGRSVLFGFAAAGWMFLLTGVSTTVAALVPGAFEALQPEREAILMSRSPLALSAMSFLIGAPVVLLGILIPVSITRKRFSASQQIVVLLVGLTLFSALASFVRLTPIPLNLLTGVIGAMTIVLPFWLGDLLAAIVTMTVTGWMTAATFFITQPAPSLRASGLALTGALALLLVGAAIVARRGREPSEDEWRPEYARNIAARVALESEISAAREAQLRVMPRIVPVVPGAVIAAQCRPAREVSGDYYDFFDLGSDRLAIVVAHGEALPFTSALAVTFAKGMLLSYAPRILSPEEVLSRVETHVRGTFGESRPFAMFYGVLHARERRLEYASLGSSVAAVSIGTGVRWLTTASRGSVAPLRRTVVTFEPRDRLVVFTPGLAEAGEEERLLGDDGVVQAAAGAPDDAPAILHELFRAAESRSGSATPSRDWTAVVVAFGGSITALDERVELPA